MLTAGFSAFKRRTRLHRKVTNSYQCVRQDSLKGIAGYVSIKSQMSALLAVSCTEANQITLLQLTDPECELATISLKNDQPFGLAFDQTYQWLYSACWTSAQITAVNLSVLKEERSFSAPRLPAWATRRDGSSEIWISCEGAGVITIIDTRTGDVSGQIMTGAGPSDIVFTDQGRRAWITNEKDGNVSVVDAEMRSKICDIPVGEIPQGMALAGGGTQLLVANFGSNSISVIDVTRRVELTQIPVGRGPVDVIAVGGEPFERAFVSCFEEGAVSVVVPGRHEQLQSVITGGKPQGLEIHPNTSRLYVAVRDLDELLVLTTDYPCKILRRLKMSGGPARMAIAPDSNAYKDIPSH